MGTGLGWQKLQRLPWEESAPVASNPHVDAHGEYLGLKIRQVLFIKI